MLWSWIQLLRPTWFKDKTNSRELTFDLHTGVIAHTYTLMFMHAGTQVYIHRFTQVQQIIVSKLTK